MKHWEYKIERKDLFTESYLNSMGKAGWELVTTEFKSLDATMIWKKETKHILKKKK
jgi:hypothetical protein